MAENDSIIIIITNKFLMIFARDKIMNCVILNI